jgi:ribosome maturation factor RimP
MDIASRVYELLKASVEEAGYILDEVLYEKEDGNYFLRVIIDKHGIIDIEDCVKVTRIVDPMLDTVDYITDSYILDVCSKEKGCE